jgi:ElaB/YqjD/DUF883 family membrane-anchored ribosome-binding protein
MTTKLNVVAETARELGRDVKDSVADFGRSAGRKIDVARDQTGDALHAAASSMRRGSAKIDHLATGAAKRLDATASFVEDANLKGLIAGARRFGKNHLTLTLLVAAAVGFVAGVRLSAGAHANGRAMEPAE